MQLPIPEVAIADVGMSDASGSNIAIIIPDHDSPPEQHTPKETLDSKGFMLSRPSTPNEPSNSPKVQGSSS